MKPSGRYVLDSFALALEKTATVVTGDPEFKHVENRVAILWVPR